MRRMIGILSALVLMAATVPAVAQEVDRTPDAHWRALARKRPAVVRAAIAAAERKGWKPTTKTLHATRGTNRSAGGLRTIGLAQGYASSGDGEILVWEWDDGDPNTAEGTVWAHSFHSGNEVVFNVQFAGATYDDGDIAYYEGIDGYLGDGVLSGAAGPGRSPFGRAILRVQSVPSHGYHYHGACEADGFRAGAACMLRAARERLREGVRGAAASAAVGGVVGAYSGGLLGALSGAVASVGPGFISGVIGSLIWGTDYECAAEANQAWDACAALAECRTRQGCVLNE